MSKKSKKPDYSNEPRKYQDGESVLILRPSLYSGAVGEVVGFTDGLHRIRIPCKDQSGPTKFWHAEVRGEEMELYL